MVEPVHQDSSHQLLALVLTFSQTYSNINRHYSFSGRWRARRQRDVSGNFVNLKDLSTQSFGGAHKDRVACVCL
jgi:hypothetical protein